MSQSFKPCSNHSFNLFETALFSVPLVVQSLKKSVKFDSLKNKCSELLRVGVSPLIFDFGAINSVAS